MLKRSVIIGLVLFSLLVVVVLLLIITGNCCFPDRCEIPIGKHQNFPIIVNLEEKRFIYPTDNDALVLSRDESVVLGCPGSKLNIGEVYTKITCITETFFLVFDDNIDVTSLYCEDSIKSNARYTGKACEYDGKEIEVGFDFGEDKFIRTMRICFDAKKQTPLYSEHNLTNSINNREVYSGRPFFDQANFFNLSGTDLFRLYTRKVQRATINKELGINLNSTEVIKDGACYYLARGHLAPKADFVYAVEQNATFYYVNAAPEWGCINSGSWAALEWKIRSYVSERKSPLQIITGTFGDLILAHHSSAEPLHLYSNGTSKAIPVPGVFWKIVFDPVSQLGVAFVVDNNPYLLLIKKFCKDVSDSLSWIKFNNKNTTTGTIYACDIHDLSSTITYIPQLPVKGLLIK